MKTQNEIYETLKSIYDWPIDREQSWLVYNNFKDLLSSGDSRTVDFFIELTRFDKSQRRQYRSHLADLGFELRPDELNQYIVLIMLAIVEVVEV
jgi:hypothetical protein